MVKESGHLLKESKTAKKKFVAQETPMENASKLSAQDHSTYRKAELAVAQVHISSFLFLLLLLLLLLLSLLLEILKRQLPIKFTI